jgi:hypothetical protein
VPPCILNPLFGQTVLVSVSVSELVRFSFGAHGSPYPYLSLCSLHLHNMVACAYLLSLVPASGMGRSLAFVFIHTVRGSGTGQDWSGQAGSVGLVMVSK